MGPEDLKAARLARGLSQVRAAKRLGVSQAYLAMLEGSQRRLTPSLAREAVKAYGLAPAALPPSDAIAARTRVTGQTLAADLAALGYPGFVHLRPRRWTPRNPAEVLLSALGQDSLEARVVEALPWLLLAHWPLDSPWLVREAKLRDLQNRLGFVVNLARRVAESGRRGDTAAGLRDLEQALERSRLAREDVLGRAPRSEAERAWLRKNRPAAARHWNLLTDWTVGALRYVV